MATVSSGSLFRKDFMTLLAYIYSTPLEGVRVFVLMSVIVRKCARRFRPL